MRVNSKVGDRLRATEAVDVEGIVSFAAPFSRPCGGTLLAGTVIVIEEMTKSRGVWARPEAYELFEERLVAPKDRASEVYDSYALAIPFETLASSFEVLP